MDFTQARKNMVESQICPNGVTNGALIDALMDVEREKFVDHESQPIAYSGQDLALPGGRFILSPMVFARLVQLAGVKSRDLVLDVGAGSGYSSAVLAQLAESVIGLEENSALCERAGATLVDLGVVNAAIICGELAKGIPEEAPFDVIIVNGRIPAVPENLVKQLNDGGRLVAIIGEKNCARATLITKNGDTISDLDGFDACAPALSGFVAEKPKFEF